MGDTITQTRFKNVSKHSNDSLLAREDKDHSPNEIASLKRRVKKLEQKKRLRTHGLKRLHKVGMSRMVESSGDEEDLGENAFKQGRRINAINVDEDITLVNVQDNDDNEMFDVDALNYEEVFVAEQEVANEKDDDGEITLAQVLIEMKSIKPKVKGVVIQEPDKSTTTKSSQLSSQQSQDKGKGIMIEEPVKPMKKKVQIILDEEAAKRLQAEFDLEERLAREKDEANVALTEERYEANVTLAQALIEMKSTNPKDKGKGIMIKEPVKPIKKKVQIMLDKEATKRLQAKFNKEERLAKEKHEANVALTKEWDDIQAKIEADHELAQRLQAEEQEELSDAEKATLFQQLLEKIRKHFAAKKAEEQRNKPPT
ncbi:hypothetical protein Tco_0879872 [Tanacetum coccineum]